MRPLSAILLAMGIVAQTGFLQADTLEQSLARKFIPSYGKNEQRLLEIEQELGLLPEPYLREPTGTGGYLSHEHQLFSSTDTVSLVFSWDAPVSLDAVALFPLRLFMDEIYSENLYWPGTITIEARINGQMQVIAEHKSGKPSIPLSLPELVTFDPATTQTLVIRCTDLPQHPYEKWHAAGFAEICIFSGADNLAPRANCTASSSRQGYHVLAKEFLTDGQTPLGLPELSSRSQPHPFLKKLGWRELEAPRSYVLTCHYPNEIPIDAVRIDPAIQHSYGQSFPVRFTIDLLDAQGEVLQSDNTYEEFPLRGPGLNPHFAYFPETMAQSVRLTVLEASQPVPKAAQAIAFSEFTPLHQGLPAPRPVLIEEQYGDQTRQLKQGRSPDSNAEKMLASAIDGFTQAGQVLALREWVEGLVQRQQLLEERRRLRMSQSQSLTATANSITRGSLALLVFGIGGASFLIFRYRLRTRREIRTTRVKLASDLHDDVGSNLGTIILHVERLKENSDAPPEEKRLNAIYRLTRESVFGLREVLNTTAPEVGKTQDLVAYMQELPSLILGRTRYTFDAAPAMSEKLSDHLLRKGLLLFYKEALYNAKTHSGCTQIDISLTSSESKIILRVKDDGKGIDEPTLKKPQTLRTLKQRAEWLHAQLDIRSHPDKGTEVTLSIPNQSVA